MSGCLTPGAVYSTSICSESIAAVVRLPHPLNLSEAEAEHLERAVHDALELALAPMFATHLKGGAT